MPGAIGNYLGWALSNQMNQNPTMSYFEGMKAAGVPAEMQLRSAQAQQAMGELEKERKLTGAMQGIDLSKPEGFGEAIAAAGKVDPIFALKLQATKQAMDVDARKAFSETLTNTMGYMSKALQGVVSVPQYASIYKNIQSMSPSISAGMPHPAEFVKPDGSPDNEKLQSAVNMMTNRSEIIKSTPSTSAKRWPACWATLSRA